jgi:hypothetical protein
MHLPERYMEQVLQVHITYQMYKEAVKVHRITGHDGPGRRPSSFNLSWNVRGISVVDSTNVNNIGRFQLPYCYQLFFQVCTLLEPLGDGAVKVVTVGNCFFNGFVNRSMVMGTEINCYGACHNTVDSGSSVTQIVAHICNTALAVRYTVHIW